MKSRKHTKLKSNPIVRFIRGVFRLFRVLFRPKRDVARLDIPRPAVIETRIIEEPSFELDRLVTVGELLGRVKWQSSSPTIQKELTSDSRISQPHDVSRN
jgi:hypothetical protein